MVKDVRVGIIFIGDIKIASITIKVGPKFILVVAT
jgi:hypothetical protein